jgi:hypothetical protein
MSTLILEADKTALIRDILNIDNAELIHQLRQYLSDHKTSEQEEKAYTAQMIKKFSGAWKDDESTAEEMVDDIYRNRSNVHIDDVTNTFNE